MKPPLVTFSGEKQPVCHCHARSRFAGLFAEEAGSTNYVSTQEDSSFGATI